MNEPTIQPVRLQRRRTKGFRLVSPNGLPNKCVCRPSKFGNPYRAGKPGPSGIVIDRQGAMGFFEMMLRDPQRRAEAGYPSDEEIKRELRGHNLACYCEPGKPCHADVLLRIANE